MSKLPVCSGLDAVKAFGKIGYAVDHQTGSHIILRHSPLRRLTSPITASSPKEPFGH
jgi:predicted RNA binding protein YcfA (HicA-like mRNA interferase family)